jgi:hypothetical protein
VKVTQVATITSINLEVAMSGADTTCPATGNCGVHIHTGTSCAAASGVGGHYYNTTADPWSVTPYTSAQASGAVFNIAVDAGLTPAQVTGRAVVVHGATGTRIGCGLIVATPPPPPPPPASSHASPVARLVTAAALLSVLALFF